LIDALFTSTQQRVLSLLFGRPGRSFFTRELIELTESGSGAVQRELRRLADAGLVVMTKQGNQKHFQANRAAPIKDGRLQDCSQKAPPFEQHDNTPGKEIAYGVVPRAEHACALLYITTLSPTSADNVGIGRWCHARPKARLEQSGIFQHARMSGV
jgi:hypothetical protein